MSGVTNPGADNVEVKWPRETLLEFLQKAEANGTAEATLSSERQAKLFRFALYHFRATEKIAADIRLTIDGHKVVGYKTQAPKVEIS